MTRLFVAACAVACALLYPFAALAQTSTVDVGSIFGAWRPYIVELMSILVMVVVGLLAELARRKLNLSIEASHRDALQTALTNGAGYALNKLGNSLEGKTVDVGSPAVAAAVNYVGKSAPDALRKFGLGEREIAEKIVAKLPQVANTTTPPAGS